MSAEFLTVEEVAEKLRCHPQTVRVWVHSGQLAAIRAGRKWLIRPEALEQFLRQVPAKRAQ